MFTVKRFDEKFLEILPTVNSMMNEKQSFLRKLEEASEADIMLDESKYVNDTIIEHTTTEGKMSGHLHMIAATMMENEDLAKFVTGIASKLSEATELTAFENTILSNVLKNSKVNEGFTTQPDFDRERYTDLSAEGLEGPFRFQSGIVLYYDPKEGKYYDRDSDMYLSHEEFAAHDQPSQHRMSEEGQKTGVEVASLSKSEKKQNKQRSNKVARQQGKQQCSMREENVFEASLDKFKPTHTFN